METYNASSTITTNTVTVYTHDGAFHADEVMAIAILQLVYPTVKINRTRKLPRAG